MQEIMYRYEAHGESIVLYTLVVIKATTCGKWVKHQYGKPKFVLNDAVKRYAHDTKAAALESLRRRTSRRVVILTAQLGASQLILGRLTGATPETVVMTPDHFEFFYED